MNEVTEKIIVSLYIFYFSYKSKSCATYEEILLKHPRDAYSVQSAHFGYLYLGDKVHHRDLVGKVLIDWDKQMPHYGLVDYRNLF